MTWLSPHPSHESWFRVSINVRSQNGWALVKSNPKFGICRLSILWITIHSFTVADIKLLKKTEKRFYSSKHVIVGNAQWLAMMNPIFRKGSTKVLDENFHPEGRLRWKNKTFFLIKKNYFMIEQTFPITLLFMRRNQLWTIHLRSGHSTNYRKNSLPHLFLTNHVE